MVYWYMKSKKYNISFCHLFIKQIQVVCLTTLFSLFVMHNLITVLGFIYVVVIFSIVLCIITVIYDLLKDIM